ncbi:MAG: aminotransferase class IV, partial [Acidobacteria bacterium]|nr:aminotransferase class IV [Acidobacteriota bacterium]
MSRVLLTWVDGGGDTPSRDRGLLYGEGLFETIRVAAGRPFRLRAHLERMARSARELDLPLPPAGRRGSPRRWPLWPSGLPAEDGRARLTITAGPAPEPGDPAAAPSGPASLFLSVSPLAADAALAQAVTARFAGPPAPA